DDGDAADPAPAEPVLLPLAEEGGPRVSARRLLGARWASTVIGALLAAVYIVPVYWMVATSLKRPGDVFADPPDIVPSPVSFGAYAEAVFANTHVLRGLANSTVVGAGTTLLTLALALPAAYGTARFRLRFVSAFLLLFLVVQMI